MSSYGYRGPAAAGFSAPGGGTADDLLDLFDPELWRHCQSSPGLAERGAAAAALFACTGARLQEACLLKRSGWAAGRGKTISLAGVRCAPRIVPVLPMARLVIARYIDASIPATGCDEVFLKADGSPATPECLRSQFRALGRRIGLDGRCLPARLRVSFGLWIDETDDQEAAAALIGRSRSPSVGLARKSAVLIAHHPLGRTDRSALHRRGPVPRRSFDLASYQLSSRAKRDIALRTKGPYPDELRHAVVQACDAGHFNRDIAQRFGISLATLTTIKARAREGRLELPGGGELRLASNRQLLVKQARAHPDWTPPMLVAWLREQHGIEATYRSVRDCLRGPRKRKRSPRRPGFAAYEAEIRAKLDAEPYLTVKELRDWLVRERDVAGSEVTLGHYLRRWGVSALARRPGRRHLAQYKDEILALLQTAPRPSSSKICAWLAEEKNLVTNVPVLDLFIAQLGVRRPRPLAAFEDELRDAWLANPSWKIPDAVAWAASKGMPTTPGSVEYALRKLGIQRSRTLAALEDELREAWLANPAWKIRHAVAWVASKGVRTTRGVVRYTLERMGVMTR